MKKMKRNLALFMACVLALGIGSMNVFAADPAEVTVGLKTSVAPAIKGEIYEVTLNVSDASIGGVQGTLTYDAEKFELNETGNVTVTQTFAEANRMSDSTNLIKDDGAGTINFALLSDGSSTDWITFNFLVLGDAGTADFTLSNVVVSNAAGTARIATVNTVDKTGVAVYDHVVDINGASVKIDGSMDIRFEIEYDPEFSGGIVKSIGLILIPTKYVSNGQELTVTTDAVYSDKKAAIVEKDLSDGETIVYANLKNSSTENNLNTEYTARAFVRLDDETVLYSDNIVETKNIDNGMSSRSCVAVAKAVAAELGYTPSEEVQAILDKTEAWTVDEYKAVITENNANLNN